MKTLYIIRHAKSSWNYPGLSDFERPLNERGKRDAPRMGKRLKEKGVRPDLFLSSPAKRAFSTAKRIANVLGYEKEHIKTDKKLYHADDETMLEVIHGLKNKYNEVMVFGHNPGLTDFVNALMDTEHPIDNIPTSGVVCFQFQTDAWATITWGTGHLLFFDYPKSKID
jgi:phosphohistidine phosphatase